jgi:hypothetical protein
MAPLGNGLGNVVRILAVLERDECLVLVEGEEVSTWVLIQDVHAGDSLYWCKACKKEEVCKITPDRCKCQDKKEAVK